MVNGKWQMAWQSFLPMVAVHFQADLHQPESSDRASHLFHHSQSQIRRRLERRELLRHDLHLFESAAIFTATEVKNE